MSATTQSAQQAPTSLETPAATRSRVATQFLVVSLAVFIVMVDGFDLQAIGFVAPEIARSWGVDIKSFGSVFGAALAGSMLGAMAAGSLARWLGLRAVLILSLLVFGGCTLAMAWADSLQTLATLRFVAGLGLGATVPVVMSIVAVSSSPRYRATLVAVTLCGQPVGAILGGFLCAHFIPLHGWQFAFYLGGVLPLLLIAPVLSVSTASAAAADREQATANNRWRDLFSEQLCATTLLLWLSVFLSSLLLYIVVNWLPASLRSEGHSLQASVLAISLFNFGGIGGALMLGPLMDRYGPLKVIPPVYAIAAVCLAALDPLKSLKTWFFAAALLSGLTAYGAGMSLGPTTLLLYPPALRTLGTGWVMGVGRLGAAIGPWGAGLLMTSMGFAISRLFYVAAAAAVLVLLLLMVLARVPRPSLDQT
jgi:MFS transporter, AAHS family, 4-hydroxybenzoate transporter